VGERSGEGIPGGQNFGVLTKGRGGVGRCPWCCFALLHFADPNRVYVYVYKEERNINK
jgi:hypothetical protein